MTDESSEPSGTGSASDPSLITQVSHRAMATEFVVMLAANCAARVESAVTALDRLDVIEGELTVYRSDSEISRLNRDGASRPVQLSPSNYGLLKKAWRWSDITGGAFDVTAGPLVQAWGFMERSGKKPDPADLQDALNRVGYQHLVFDDSEHSVQFARPGMSVNLGGIGKGFALDVLAEALEEAGVHDFLIHGGQSSVLARGNQTPDSGLGWAVGLAHPTKPKRRLAGIWLRDAAIGTSGSGKQFFHHRGRRYGHVIDPRTGQPAGDLLSLTATMRSAADADACATGLFVCGREAAKETAEAIDGPNDGPAPLLLVRPTPRQDEVAVETVGDWSWLQPPEGDAASE